MWGLDILKMSFVGGRKGIKAKKLSPRKWSTNCAENEWVYKPWWSSQDRPRHVGETISSCPHHPESHRPTPGCDYPCTHSWRPWHSTTCIHGSEKKRRANILCCHLSKINKTLKWRNVFNEINIEIWLHIHNVPHCYKKGWTKDINFDIWKYWQD